MFSTSSSSSCCERLPVPGVSGAKRTLEGHVLQKVRGTVGARGLRARTGVDPGADRGSLGTRGSLSGDGKAVGEHSHLGQRLLRHWSACLFRASGGTYRASGGRGQGAGHARHTGAPLQRGCQKQTGRHHDVVQEAAIRGSKSLGGKRRNWPASRAARPSDGQRPPAISNKCNFAPYLAPGFHRSAEPREADC